MLTYMKCIQDFNLVIYNRESQPFLIPNEFKLKAPNIFVSHNHF